MWVFDTVKWLEAFGEFEGGRVVVGFEWMRDSWIDSSGIGASHHGFDAFFFLDFQVAVFELGCLGCV